ncbi:MAG: hypothetical protein KGZ87_01415 [Bacteroidetes bacterium]|nr:hypothetical protein [Bacteroidota bacterium]
MKKLALFILVMGLVIPTIAASTINHSYNTEYDKYRPIEFEEDGILFFVFPDGEFEFEVLYPRHVELGFRFRNGHIRLGKHLPLRIEQDRYGNIYRIENILIDYNRFGKVSRIGSVDIHYNHGRIRTIGYMDIIYRQNYIFECVGHVKHKNYYSYDNHYNKNKNYYKPYKKHYKKDYSHNTSYREREYDRRDINNERDVIRNRRPYSN